MTEIPTTAIIGLGLIGGSLARDLSALGVEVLAHDRDPEAVQAAIRDGVARAELGPDLAGIERARLVVIATPVDSALETLRQLRPYLRNDLVITDVGSVKRPIGEEAAALAMADRFVGSHPLTGDHRSGWAASRSGLFVGQRIYLCASPEAPPHVVARVRSLWTGVGGRIEMIDAEEHDRRMALLSHLPQVMSSTLARTLREAGNVPTELGPGGRDCVRLAASSPEMWTAISLANADEILTAISHFREQLGLVESALRHGDSHALYRFFDEARRWST